MASRGAWSPPHIDRAGVVTTVHVEFGDKVWISWPADIDKLRDFAWTGEPVSTPMLVYLEQGDTLVQPAGTPHAPYTGPYEKVCFITGAMFITSQDLEPQAKCSLKEKRSKQSITNEDESIEASVKISDVGKGHKG